MDDIGIAMLLKDINCHIAMIIDLFNILAAHGLPQIIQISILTAHKWTSWESAYQRKASQ
jgi:hypothetical protein